ncbi:MAG: hypothetical protein RBS80_03070 [Thermoguttaceae bacterium]|jgi:hypothetical protein|nr:hypothetical protein [Thermoguttaceae bacterium]
MTNAPDTDRIELAPQIQAVLAKLRARIRRYVWIEGLATATVWVGFAFWMSLLGDWFFEPRPAVRLLALAAAGLMLLTIVARRIVLRLLVPLADTSMATVLERHFPQLDDALLTAVFLSSRPSDPRQCNPEMLDRTCREASERIGGVRVREVFNFAPLRRRVGLALAVSASVIAFALVQPSIFGIWVQRSLALSPELWPRYTRLVVEGFDEEGCIKLARGSEFELIAKADMSWPVVPQVIEVRYRAEGGRQQRESVGRQGNAVPGRDPFQEYSHRFESVLASVELDVFGGDAAVRGLRIEVVDSPAINEMQLTMQLPEYTGRPNRIVPVSGVMQVPLGSRLLVHARSSKPLVRVRIDSMLEEPPPPPIVLETGALDPDRRGFTIDVPPLMQDKTLQFTLFDTDGIQSREPTQLRLVAIADTAPQLAVRLRGIGTAVTPQARLPIAGEIHDDYGVARTWFEYAIDQGKISTRPIGDWPATPPTVVLNDEALEVADLALAVGQKLNLSVKAEDRYDLSGRPNVGSGDRWQLEVVTPDQLRTMLEARELVLRQRFEQIIREATETRDLLARMEFANPAGREEGSGETGEDEQAGEDGGGDDQDAQGASPMRQLTRRTLRVQRALQNSRKNVHETKSVADAFDDIELQLINNRVDTEELRFRIAEGIAQPLHAIADKAIPELERRLDSLQESLDDGKLGPARRDRARQQADEVLLAMQLVLQRMIELESFNEAVDMLRQIIALQGDLQEQTKERQKQKVRDLLEN